MKRSIRQKLMGSHRLVAVIGLAMLAVGLISAIWVRSSTLRLADLRAPMVQNALHAHRGLEQCLANLRGWIVLGDPAFKATRAAAWTDEIDPSMAELRRLGRQLADVATPRQLSALTTALEDLREWQWWIEEVAHTPGNEPARNLYEQDMRPIIERSEMGITALIDREKRTVGEGVRKDLMGAMADFR
ncbi:MAG: hypothetical protein OER86_00120, partial [Phycisphaerae bacterium]|nr:hypothetical protein [Phycisphaerae bacterium]